MSIRGIACLLLGRHFDSESESPGPGLKLSGVTNDASWLVQLRWVAVAGQLATIEVARYLLDVWLPIVPLVVVVAITALSNLALAAWSAAQHSTDDMPGVRSSHPTTVPVLGLVLLLDLVLLTVLLGFSGGPTNPFFIFYFVNVCLGAVVLPRSWAIAESVVSIACFGVLLYLFRPLPEIWTAASIEPLRLGEPLTRAHWGLLVAFTTCAAVIVHFTSVLRDQLRKRELQLHDFQADRARTHKLEALGTLAAGAAHELANPLGTIAVAAREVERRVAGTKSEATVSKDVALIRSELETCRNILKRMSADAGQAIGEQLVTVSVSELLDETLEGIRAADRVTISLSPAVDDVSLKVPLVGLAQALRGLLQNALAASATVQRVRVTGDRLDGDLRLTIRDEGVGMSPAVLARVGDPFFTTKEPGRGTGLGVFLARAVVERLAGHVTIESISGRGTTVTIVLPIAHESASRPGSDD